MCSKKDYVAIAGYIAVARSTAIMNADNAGTTERMEYYNGTRNGIEIAIGILADYFGEDNSNFDRGRFYTACTK